MIERYLSWSAIGSAGLFALLGLVAVVTSNSAAMLAAIIVLIISILLAVSILIYAALPKDKPD
ncbi:MAG: hypothetical protein EBS83_12085 [Planctomycetia bacterium]|jgi:divalent metal cation (Fe/Co/Zn/Cd) transporter|nr:hypothetical protein [Planctomycetia bacterium]